VELSKISFEQACLQTVSEQWTDRRKHSSIFNEPWRCWISHYSYGNRHAYLAVQFSL